MFVFAVYLFKMFLAIIFMFHKILSEVLLL